MTKSGKDILKLAKKMGWKVIRVNGSHYRLEHSETKRRITLVIHANRSLAIGTEQKILKDLGLK